MARALTSLLLCALVSLACAEPFGRFGYVTEGVTPGFEITKEGFRVRHSSADWFKFDNPARTWKPVTTSDVEQIVNLSGVGRSPDKLRQHLLGVGFSLYFRYGIRFRLGSTAAPYVSWTDGSGGPDVPTPSSKWLAISFRDSQPPVLLVFSKQPVSMKLTGKAGEWSLRSDSDYDGWVRVIAPNGTKALPTNRAADLGELSQLIAKEEALFLTPVANLKSVSVDAEPGAIGMTCTFDEPGAVVPSPLYLAPIAGNKISTTSPVRVLDSFNEEGPIQICTGTELKIRMPGTALPLGRAVFAGLPTQAAIATASPHDIPSVCELALANLFGWRDYQTLLGARETFDTFLAESTYQPEPNTNQLLPYDAAGKALDLAAANALLMQCLASSSGVQPTPNSLLTSLGWRRDWKNWRYMGVESDAARRGAALAILAGLVGTDPVDRLESARLQAGLDTERGLAIWQRRRKIIPSEPPLLEVLENLRRAALSPLAKHPALAAFSGLRVISDLAVIAKQEGTLVTLKLEFGDIRPRRVDLRCETPFTLKSVSNVAATSLPTNGGMDIEIAPKQPGPCEIQLEMTPGFTLPPVVEPLRYEGVMR